MSELLPENDLNPHPGYTQDLRPTYEEIVTEINKAWKDICSKIEKRNFQYEYDGTVIYFEKEITVREENFNFSGSINIETVPVKSDNNKRAPLILVLLNYNDPHLTLTGTQLMLEERPSDQVAFGLKYVTIEDGNLKNVEPGKVITTFRETGFQQSGAGVKIVIENKQYSYDLYSDCNNSGLMNALSHELSRVSFKIPEKTNIV